MSARPRADLTPEARDLACTVAELAALARGTRLSQRAVAEAVFVAPSTLTEYTTGRRSPSRDLLRKLWSLAAESQEVTGQPPPPLEQVLETYRKAVLARQSLLAPEDTAAVPPSSQARIPETRTAREATPTPPPIADDEALGHLRAGRDADAATFLWHAGRTHAPVEIRDAVTAYRTAGRTDAAEAMLNSAAARDLRAVLSIVGTLLEAQQVEDAATLVNAALSHHPA
ncbi:helix-turn-helix domain-containing protein [Streptomyces albofaciens]|uniref:helix-turn-helix domain-containing protein n=1 Tax=Streptomyces albofaciens TaxID=66866 RepID=UPI0012391261|nr:helix-turn-helix transcriptional regulator [Streptomyces albofaciens]